MEVVPMMIATVGPIGRRFEATTLEQRPTDEYPGEIEIPTGIVLLKSRPPRYRDVQTSGVVVVLPVRTMTDVVKEGAGVSFE